MIFTPSSIIWMMMSAMRKFQFGGARLPRLYHAETQNGKTAGESN